MKRNIENLRNKIGDARTGGKGSQRRKVKVVAKNTVINPFIFRVAQIKPSKPS